MASYHVAKMAAVDCPPGPGMCVSVADEEVDTMKLSLLQKRRIEDFDNFEEETVNGEEDEGGDCCHTCWQRAPQDGGFVSVHDANYCSPKSGNCYSYGGPPTPKGYYTYCEEASLGGGRLPCFGDGGKGISRRRDSSSMQDLCACRRRNGPSSTGNYECEGNTMYFTQKFLSENPASQQWGGRLRWYGNFSACEALAYLPNNVVGLADCSNPQTGDHLWDHLWESNSNSDCGDVVVEMFTFGNWRRYLGVVERAEQANLILEMGQVYAVTYPGLPVPCDVGGKFLLDPFPRTGEIDQVGCFTKPSDPFQIKVEKPIDALGTKGCLTVTRDQYGIGKVVKVKPCDHNWHDVNQLFTLEAKGCD
eukprot:CAMPEP_0117509740 /NCGR_PEP_ID=MMETSP0784-20121206/27633_1 /TAXON_ID=39447 /ORGANISM="" /LENGTH=361 /DNA_ID=CAMNT_0005305361 /DNA_START=135 /DNA_END=1220 /DNA_ORIENTATION=-